MASVIEQVKARFDSDARQFTIDFDMDVNDNDPHDEFYDSVIPYAIGYADAAGYGVTEIEYVEKTITFTRVQTMGDTDMGDEIEEGELYEIAELPENQMNTSGKPEWVDDGVLAIAEDGGRMIEGEIAMKVTDLYYIGPDGKRYENRGDVPDE